MKKKLLSLALALALCLGLTVPAFAAEVKIVEVPVPTVEEYEGKNYRVSVNEFHDGLSKMWLYEGSSGSPTGTGFIDWTGKVVIPAEYGGGQDFSEGFAAVLKNGKWGFVDKTGKEVVPFSYDGAQKFSEGLAAVMKNNKIGFVDKTGKEVIPCTYSNSAEGFSQGLAAVEKDGKWGFIDTTGKEVVEPKTYTENGKEYSYVQPIYQTLPSFIDGRAYLQRALKSGSVDNFVPNFYFTLTVDAKVADWAREQVDLAAAKGLMPDTLGDDFTVNITRAEFAAVAVELYEAMSGDTAPAPGESPFSDTSDPVVLQANALGIVKGSGGKFRPDDLVSRQEAALMLSRVYTRLGGTIPQTGTTTFADDSKISPWTGLKDAIAFMSDNKIVTGKGNNTFDPLGNASIQEAMVIALRMFENLDVQ